MILNKLLIKGGIEYLKKERRTANIYKEICKGDTERENGIE